MNQEINKENTIVIDKDDVDLNKIINTSKRNKWLIVGITIFATISGIIYSLIKKPVYRGYFQIIVESRKNNTDSQMFKNSSPLQSLTNLVSGNNNDNKTQEAILRSSSVLKPVFEFVKEESKDNNVDISKSSYLNWLSKYLDIEFEEGTNVLTINFENQDKELIISTLNLISSKYQDYSKRDRERTITKGINYLENQEKKYKEKSINSLKKLNQFSIDNGLGDIDGFVELDEPISRNLSNNLKQILNINADSGINFLNQTNSGDTSGAGQRYSTQFSLLEKYEAQFSDLSSVLKPNSSTLRNLENKIKNLKESLKRPNQILVEFRNLKRIARRNENLLENIENNLSILRLEQVKQQTPWELITEPTIYESRVEPKRKQITIISFLTSLILSVFIAILKEKKEDKVYEIESFKEKIPYPLKDIFLEGETKLNELIIKNKYIDPNNETIGIIKLDNSFFSKEFISTINLPKNIKTKKFDISNIQSLKEIDKIILLAKKGEVTFKQLDFILKFLNTYENSKFSWIFVANRKL